MTLVTESELTTIGERLGAGLEAGSVVTIAGDLGTGKTTLVQAIVRGLGVTTRATSPTYALVHRYDGARGPVFHLDCYRLQNPGEAADLGWDEMLAEGDAILVEWPERAGGWVPEATHRIRLAHVDDPARRELELA